MYRDKRSLKKIIVLVEEVPNSSKFIAGKGKLKVYPRYFESIFPPN